MSNYLFTLTITPVQSFISQARKTKDLFAGSEILSNLVKETLKQFDTKEIIFPQNSDFTSNKFVLVLKRTEEEIRKLGEKLEEFIHNEFYNLGADILLNREDTTVDLDLFQNHFKPQLCNFFQVFWVAVELKEDDYKKSYRKLEQNLGAVKNLRTFEQLAQISGRKCSVCGERNGLFYNREKPHAFMLDKAIKINTNQIEEQESLCAVCFTKRFYPNSQHFDSTQEIKNDKGYYALIHFDIDNMGEELSKLNKDEQIALSQKLGAFAYKAREIVSKKNTIYTGGDDFLGFVELDKLFDTISKITDIFKETIPNMTFSTSIIICHWKTPLHKVLDYSRELLATTKNHFDNKNGVGIIVMSSSAINAQTICKYHELTLLDKMREKEIGMGLHYKLQTIFSYLDSMSYDEYLMQKQMIKTEIKRLLKRENGELNESLYNKLIAFLGNQKIKHATNCYEIDFDNFIGYLKTLEQLKKVM